MLIQIADDPLWLYHVQLYAADIPFAIVALLAAPDLIGAVRRRTFGPVGALALLTAGLFLLALAVHPSAIGLQTALRLLAALALATVVSRLRDDERSLVAGTIAVAAIVQLALAVAQLARGGPLGLPQLGEFADPLLRFGSSLAPRGTMEHPYLLAGLAVVAAGALLERAIRAGDPRRWIPVLAVSVAPTGLTFSRSSPLGIGLTIAALLSAAARGSAAHRWAIAALVVGAGIPAVLSLDGWTSRTVATVTNEHPWGGEVRGDMVAQTLELMRDDLVFGVGPGQSARATRELERRAPERVTTTPPVHNVPLLVASEAGIPAGLAATALLVALGVAAHRNGILAGYLLFLPFLMFDQFAYTRLQGVVLLGIWAGTLHGGSRAGQPASNRDTPPSDPARR